MQFTLGFAAPPPNAATVRNVPTLHQDEQDEEQSAPRALDASGTFHARPEEAKREERIIPLPEAYQRLAGAQEQNVRPVERIQGRKEAAGAGAPQYVPGLQFVGKAVAKKQAEKAVGAEALTGAPLLLLNQLPGLAEIRDEGEKFKRDVQMRPAEADLAAYDEMPVEDFGKALLRGMGWREGGAVGKSNAAVVEPIQYIPRPEGLGLGADAPSAMPEPPEQKRRKILRPGEEEKNARDKQYVMPTTADGKVRHYQTGSGPLVEKKALVMKSGAHVAVARGVHSGLVGTVATITANGLMVKLKNSDAVVAVKKDDVLLFDPALLRTQAGVEQIRGMVAAAQGQLPTPETKDSDSSSSSSDNDKASKKKKKKAKKEKKASKRSKAQMSWLTPGIVVRCISKTFQGGSLYGKKLVVVDMTDVDSASMVLLEDRRKVVENVRESVVETVVPQCGSSVRVVRGDRCGETGIVREKNSDKNRALVEMVDDGSAIVTLAMDDIAQFVGTE